MRQMENSPLIKAVRHFKHSAVRIEGSGKVLYFDPYNIEENLKDGDVIFISHIHSDHFSPSSIRKVMRRDAVLVSTEDVIEAAQKEGFSNFLTVRPGESYEVCGIPFETVPAYNLNKKFHPKQNDWVGYIVGVNAAKYYFAGDTDFIPEMKDFKADVAFLPVGGTYTMTSSEAVEAANSIKPSIAVPVHFAEIIGSREDAEYFVRGIDPSIQGVILKE